MDSFTSGVNTSVNKNYPTQLQLYLNSYSNRTFNVINKGISGQNTAQLINNLQNDINETRPDLVILLAGGANEWIYWGYKSVYKNYSFLLNDNPLTVNWDF